MSDIHLSSDSALIVTTIIALAKNMKLIVIAEGVETKEQVAFFKKHHCNEMQGYIFSRPVPAEEYEKLLERGCVIA